MPFLWTDAETIQNYIGNETIRIGNDSSDTFEIAKAELHENDAVDEIRDLISVGWSGVFAFTAADVPDTFKRMAARLAAAKIGISVVTGAIGDAPGWCVIYRSEVYSQLMRMLLARSSVGYEGLTLRTGVTDEEILIKAKQREMAIPVNE